MKRLSSFTEESSLMNNRQEEALCDSLFRTLPEEIRLHIFGYLSSRDLCNLSTVCRAFQNLANQDCFWKSKCPRSLTFSKSKPYTQIYIEWRREITLRKEQIAGMSVDHSTSEFNEMSSFETSVFRDPVGDTDCYNPFSVDPDLPVICCFFSVGGSYRHPTDSQDLAIILSVDIGRTARALSKLLDQVSVFKQQYQQSFVLKRMIQRYHRFMQLKASQPVSTVLIPTLDIEIVWQTHLLRPEIYRYDCERLFNCFVDHSLFLQNTSSKHQAFLDTCQLYEQTFGEKYCSIPLTHRENEMTEDCSYWNETFYEFSTGLLVDFQNPFSFTEKDLFLDLNWFDSWKKARSYQEEDLYLPKKLYKEFLYLAAKYRIKPGVDFLPPEYSIDLIWHSHMQEPFNYENDCHRLIGYTLHHNPCSTIDGETKKILHSMSNELWYMEVNPSETSVLVY